MQAVISVTDDAPSILFAITNRLTRQGPIRGWVWIRWSVAGGVSTEPSWLSVADVKMPGFQRGLDALKSVRQLAPVTMVIMWMSW